MFLALVFTAGGLVELLARGPVPAGYQQDGPALIILTVASGLSLAILWWSPLASLVVAVTLVCAQAVAGYEYTMAAIGAVVVASFATVAFDQWKRSVAASIVVVAGFVLTILVLPSATWQQIAHDLGVVLHRLGRRHRHPHLPRQHRARRAPGGALRRRPRGARP